MFNRNRSARVAYLLVGALMLMSLVFAACGDDDDDDDADTTPEATVTQEADESPTGEATATDTEAEATRTESGSDDTQAAVEDVADQMVEAWNNGDAEGFAAHFTDDGLLAFAAGQGAPPEMTADDIRTSLPEIMAGSPIELEEVKDAESNGDTASGTLVFKNGAALTADVVDLVKQGDEWLVDNYQASAGELDTEGYTAVDVEMKEFAFVFDQASVTAGEKHTFELENTGAQPHEMVLVKVDEGVDLQQALQSESEEEPEGIEFLGFASAEPGQSAEIVLADELDAGRYAMICFFPDTEDPEQTPHAFKGMLADFTIE